MNGQILYDKFHVLQHANPAIDEVRGAEFFRKGGHLRGLVKGKRSLLLTRWVHLDSNKTPAMKRTLRPKPAGPESLPAQGKSGTVVDLSLRRSHAPLLAKLD